MFSLLIFFSRRVTRAPWIVAIIRPLRRLGEYSDAGKKQSKTHRASIASKIVSGHATLE